MELPSARPSLLARLWPRYRHAQRIRQLEAECDAIHQDAVSFKAELRKARERVAELARERDGLLGRIRDGHEKFRTMKLNFEAGEAQRRKTLIELQTLRRTERQLGLPFDDRMAQAQQAVMHALEEDQAPEELRIRITAIFDALQGG